MSEIVPYQEAHWSDDTLESLIANTEVRLSWQPPHQSRRSIDGTVIEAEPTLDIYRIATPTRVGELQVYRSPKSDGFSVYTITVNGTTELGELCGITILNRPAKAEGTDGFYPAILDWRAD